MWVSRGDIFVPLCCFPCRWLAGRQHVWSDPGVDSVRYLIKRESDKDNDIGDEVVEQMRMHEGMNETDMHSICKWAKQLRSGARSGTHQAPEEADGERDARVSKQMKNHSINPWAFEYVKLLNDSCHALRKKAPAGRQRRRFMIPKDAIYCPQDAII